MYGSSSFKLVLIFWVGNAEETKSALDGIKAKLDARPGVLDAAIYSSYYRAALEYYRVRCVLNACCHWIVLRLELRQVILRSLFDRR